MELRFRSWLCVQSQEKSAVAKADLQHDVFYWQKLATQLPHFLTSLNAYSDY